MSKILNRAITINGELLKIDGAQTGLINVLRFDKNGDILEAEGPYAADSALAASKHFAKGCIWRNTEGTTGTVLYINDGTAASASFAGLSTGDITSVVAGAGMTGGGTSGAVTLNVIATDSTVTVAADGIKVATGGITNTEVSASAAIAFSKLAALNSAQVLVGSAGNVATATAITGDTTFSNTGVTSTKSTSIGSNALTAVANAATTTLAAGVVTSSTANLGAATAETLTITYASCAATSRVLANINAPGTGGNMIVTTCTPGAGSFTVTCYNMNPGAAMSSVYSFSFVVIN